MVCSILGIVMLEQIDIHVASNKFSTVDLLNKWGFTHVSINWELEILKSSSVSHKPAVRNSALYFTSKAPQILLCPDEFLLVMHGVNVLSVFSYEVLFV